MPVLTVVDVDSGHRLASAETADVCRLHARILAATDGLRGDDAGRVLWAQLPGGRLLIRTAVPVPVSRWPAGYITGCVSRLWKPPAVGNTSALLVVNPVRRSSKTVPGRITATPIPDRDIGDWLAGKLAAAGIRTTSLRLVDVRTVCGWRQGARVTHRVATCRVDATIVDADAASRLALAGVGRARSYGCGLSAWWPR